MSDTFTKAAANVRRLYSDEQWFSLPRGRRSEAICDELRRIDAECQGNLHRKIRHFAARRPAQGAGLPDATPAFPVLSAFMVASDRQARILAFAGLYSGASDADAATHRVPISMSMSGLDERCGNGAIGLHVAEADRRAERVAEHSRGNPAHPHAVAPDRLVVK